MGRSKDLSDFDKGQIVMARRLGQSISDTARLVGCSRSAVVSTYRQWSEDGQTTNRRQGVGRPRLIDARGQERLSRLVETDGRSTVAQVTLNFNDGYGKNVSQHTVHRTLLRMGLRSRRPVSAHDDSFPPSKSPTLVSPTMVSPTMVSPTMVSPTMVKPASELDLGAVEDRLV